MPTRESYQEGIPSWVDLGTTDLGAAKTYYGGLFGWDFVDAGPEGMDYVIANLNGHAVAGLAQTDRDRSMWSTYFAVDNADETADKIVQHGGQVVMGPMTAAGSGRLAFATDPTGAAFGIWQDEGHFGAGLVNEHGALTWNELTCDDLETALPFYENVFGHSFETTDGGSGPYTSVNVDGRGVAGAMPPPVPGIPNHWGVYFGVDDVAARTEKAVELGATQVFDQMEIPEVGLIAGVSHPAGGTITLFEFLSDPT